MLDFTSNVRNVFSLRCWEHTNQKGGRIQHTLLEQNQSKRCEWLTFVNIINIRRKTLLDGIKRGDLRRQSKMQDAGKWI